MELKGQHTYCGVFRGLCREEENGRDRGKRDSGEKKASDCIQATG